MTLDDAGKTLIEGFEGLVLHAYQDVAGVWTIGYGSTRYANGQPVKKGDLLLNKECASDLFLHTLGQYIEAVNTHVKVPLTQAQFNSLVSFTYNEGTGALAESHLLKKLNAGDFNGAAAEFLIWDKVTDPHTGQKIASRDLYKRRYIESKPFKTQA